MSEITISQSEYNELAKAKSQVGILSEQVAKLTDETKNKGIAIEEERTKRKELEDFKKNLETEVETLKNTHSEELSKFENYNELSEKATKWSEYETSLNEKRLENINSYKTKLGEEFLKENQGFLEGLGDDKVEMYLKTHADKIETPPDYKTGGDNGGVPPKNLGDFEKAKASGSIDGMLNAIL